MRPTVSPSPPKLARYTVPVAGSIAMPWGPLAPTDPPAGSAPGQAMWSRALQCVPSNVDSVSVAASVTYTAWVDSLTPIVVGASPVPIAGPTGAQPDGSETLQCRASMSTTVSA